MPIATINRFISLFSEAFEALSIQVPKSEIERIAMLVHHSMDQGHRTYHVSSHAFDMCEGMNPRQVLAALFHDVVYYQLDNGFPMKADVLLTRSILVDKNKNVLTIKEFEASDKCLLICTEVFGFRAGAVLELYGGLNEFLSAIVAVRLLESYLPESDLIAIVACIEATVPFRGIAVDGTGTFEHLAKRLHFVSRSFNLSLSESDIDKMVIDAIEIANRDVSSFAEEDAGTFLSTTWLLIEESNAPLATVGVYSIQDYRGALVRMEKFLSTLNPENIFHHYKDVPSPEQFAVLLNNARSNIAFSIHYLNAKIVGIAVVEALALMTGGNCPVSMFLGDIRSPYGKPDRAENFFPSPPNIETIDAELIKVLEHGRKKEALKDLTVSPLTAFVYRYLGNENTNRAFINAKEMFSDNLSPRDFLHGLNQEMVRALIQACARIALSRTELLLALEFK